MGARLRRQAGANTSNWLIDAGLFAAFVLAMLFDLTGVGVHEWLGAAAIAVAGYHLLLHWSWVKTTAARFLGRLSHQARRYLIVDTVVLAGFIAIGASGLVISTWLELPLDQSGYLVWRDAHVAASVATLVALVLTIGLHWRWVVTVAQRHVLGARGHASDLPAAQRASGRAGVERREFVRLMGGVGAMAALAATSALVDFGGPAEASVKEQQASSASTSALSSTASSSTASAAFSTPTPAAATATPAAATPAASAAIALSATSACRVRCSSECSYPGRCRKYADANGNGRCDLGECT